MNPTTEPRRRTRVTDCLLYLSITRSNKTEIVIIVKNRSRLFLHPSVELFAVLSCLVTGDKRNKYNIKKKIDSSLATFLNISKMSKIGIFQQNLSTIFVKLLNIYLFSKIFQKVKIVMLR